MLHSDTHATRVVEAKKLRNDEDGVKVLSCEINSPGNPNSIAKYSWKRSGETVFDEDGFAIDEPELTLQVNSCDFVLDFVGPLFT